MIRHDAIEVEAAGGLAVQGARAVPGTTDVRAALVADGGLAARGARAVPDPPAVRAALGPEGAPVRRAAGDPTRWGPAAEADARARLGWLDTFRHSREMLPRLAELRDEYLRLGVDHV